jgi:hypothetical protein
MHDGLPVGGQKDVELHSVNPDFTCPCKSRQRIFRQEPGCAAVADDGDPFFRHFRPRGRRDLLRALTAQDGRQKETA